MVVRRRTDADLDRCVDVARVVHQVDGYPRYLPGDLRSFLAAPDAIAAWVAQPGADIAGHVALHPRTSPAVMQVVTRVTGLLPDRFGVVARLLVSPEARGQGIGRALLREAVSRAVERGLWPMLDVATHHSPAICLYESLGWTRVDRVEVPLGDGHVLDEFVYLAPTDIASRGS